MGFVAQVLLMGLILITGNYNFFNVLTIVLSIALLSDDGLATVFISRVPRRKVRF